MCKALCLLKRHAAALALLAVLMAAVAAPYLLPADPDSPVMRSGTFGAILLLACFFPVRHAYERHSLRALGFGIAFAWIFTLCLGVGSELTFYERLLPGTGSLVRRLAVPVLCAPMLGALASFLLNVRLDAPSKKRWALPFWCYFLLFALVYGAALLAMFPGILNYDFEFEIAQFLGGQYEAKHPVFHTLLLGSLYALGNRLFGSMTAGAALYSAVQLILLAAMYAGACCFVQKRAPAPIVLSLTLCFALLPFHAILAISTVKDALFSGLCLLLCLTLWQAAENPSAFLASRAHRLRFMAICLGVSLIRLNGIFAFLPACLALPFLCRRLRTIPARAIALSALTMVLCLITPRALEAAVHAQSAPSSEMMSIPCQQLMRTAARADLSQEEYESLDAWFSGTTPRYRPHDADVSKGGNFDYARYQRDPSAFWSTYFHYAKRYPQIYLEAFLDNCLGLWYPDDTSHAHSLDSEDWDFVYLKTDNIVPDVVGTIRSHSYLPALREWLFSSAHHASHEHIPLLSLLFRPASYTFLLLFATLYLLRRRLGKWALCLLPVWGILLSLFFSAGILVRYAYPIMTAVPVLLALAFAARDGQQAQ